MGVPFACTLVVGLTLVGAERGMADRDIVERAARGEPGAFDALYHANVDRVHRHVVHIVGSDPDVDDLVQTTFIQVHRNLKTYRGDSSFSTWLHRITVNVALSHLRARKRTQSRQASEEMLDVPAPAEERPDATVSRRRDVELLYAALDTIKPDKRIAFILCDIQGHTLKEAGKILNTRLNTVAARLRSARSDLRRALLRHAALARASGRSPSLENVS